MAVRATVIWLLVAVVGSLQAGAQTPAGAGDPWVRRSSRAGDFRAPVLPWKSFAVELPRDWQIAPGHGGILLTAVERGRNNQPAGAIVLEQMLLVEPLGPADIGDVLANLEVAAARQRDPAGTDFEQQVKEGDGQRLIMIQYNRPGIVGTDRVVVYAVPAGRVMYRLICIAPADQLVKRYQPIFAHVAWSFKPQART